MSRSGYSHSLDEWDLIRWRGAVKSAIRGRRGQAFLRELRDALDAMPNKRLIAKELIDEKGEVCAIGAVCKARGVDVSGVDIEDPPAVAELVGIAGALAAEIEYENDEALVYGEPVERESWTGQKYTHRPLVSMTPETRWQHMRQWVDRHIQASEEDHG